MGIELVDRPSKNAPTGSVSAAKRKREFLKTLRARDAKVNLCLCEPWMSGRSHKYLLGHRKLK